MGDEVTATPCLAMRLPEAARSLGISERMLKSLAADGRIPHVRIGRMVLYPVDALRQWLSEQAAAGPAGATED